MSSGDPGWQGSVLPANTAGGAPAGAATGSAVGGGMALGPRVIRRIAPGSAFKLGALLTGLLGAVFGLFPLLATLLGMSLFSAASDGGRGTSVGPVLALVFYVLGVIFYALFGGLASALYAWLYNVVAGWVGGLRVELE